MQIDVLSLFPNMFEPLRESMIGKAIERELLNFDVVDYRSYSHDKHHHVDDTPYGGGAGMLLKPEPLFEAMDGVNERHPGPKRVILMDPAGKKFNHQAARALSQEDHLVFICGHYEGTDEYSLGDYVLTGGELPAMVMIDAIVRLLPGVLGNDESAHTDSFENGLLEYPQYTRPPEYRGMKVPEVLQNGNHQLIARWRQKESLRRTYLRRPDLLKTITLDQTAQKLLREVKTEEATKAAEARLKNQS